MTEGQMLVKYLSLVVIRYMLLDETYSIKVPSDEIVSLLRNGNDLEIKVAENDDVILRIIKKDLHINE